MGEKEFGWDVNRSPPQCDLVNDNEHTEIEAEIYRLNPLALVIAAVNGRVNPAILGRGLSRHTEDKTRLFCNCGGHSHVHGVTHTDEGFSALRFALAPAIDCDFLTCALLASPPGVLRIKGVAQLNDIDEPQVIQYIPGSAAYEPVVRAATGAPFILIIGRDLDALAMKRLWSPMLGKDMNS